MSDTGESEGAAVRFPPPLVPLIALAVGLAISWLVVPLPNPIQGTWRIVIGVVLLGSGLASMFAAVGLFRKSGQDPAPWEESPELIERGIYRHTRNPMYLGMGAMQAGLGVLFGSLWVVVLVPVTWTAIYFIAIRHEEAYLGEKFGAEYEVYKSVVRRWI